jgi:hypothetical protein
MEPLIYTVFGFLLGYFAFKPKKEEKAPFAFEDETTKEKEPDPMALRNGFGVTRCEKPTFAEQWVNIMNFDGRNQKEGDNE